ncbi:MAG: hypothetical protein V2J25_00685 [Desulfatiglans sp.]|nr:hypothetical protein [Desulfatiglans sp.]
MADVEGNMVGMYTIQTLVSTAEGGMVGLIEDMVVSPCFRGKAVVGVYHWHGPSGWFRPWARPPALFCCFYWHVYGVTSGRLISSVVGSNRAGRMDMCQWRGQILVGITCITLSQTSGESNVYSISAYTVTSKLTGFPPRILPSWLFRLVVV